MRIGTSYKDKGHYTRKAAWLTLGVLLFIPHAIFLGASKADEWIIHFGERMYRFSHPCLFAPRRRRDDQDA